MEDLTGKHLGPYQVVVPLGEGGMAAVYKGYHPAMERYVALKILPRQFASDPQFVSRFKQEARLLAQIQHPHILPVFDYGEADGYTYLVMPFVKSGTLADLLKGKPLPFEQIRAILSQVGGALDYAHGRGLVHRDVKPSNVLLDESGHCLLSDFGLAKILEGNEKLTTSGAIMGTPAYMSPEQGLGQPLDRRSDVYSLGVILYELATGRPPYNAETPIAVMIKHINDPLPPPSRFNPELPEALEAVVLKTLAKDPADRYQTVGALVKALEAASAEIKPAGLETFIQAQTRPVEPRSLNTQQAMAQAPTAARKPARLWQAVSPRTAIVAVAGLTVVASLAVYVSWGRLLSGRALSTQAATATAAEAASTQALSTHAPTPAGGEQARAFAEPILQAVAAQPPDFADDFSTGNGGWEATPLREYRAGEMEVADGVLRLRGVVGGLRAQADAWASSSKDFVIQFDLRVSGDETLRAEFIFRRVVVADADYGYNLILYDRGYPSWSLIEFKGPQYNEIGSRFDDISPQGEVTQVSVVARGDQVAVYLNGKPVAYGQNDEFDRGGGMLFSCLSEAAPGTCEFDNVQLWDLQNVPTAIRTSAPSGNAQARAFAEPILQAIADRPPDFADDFSTADKGWRGIPSPAYQAGAMEIANGVMGMNGVLGQLEAETSSLAPTAKDFVFQFDARLVSGDESSQLQFFFHANERSVYQVIIFGSYPSWAFRKSLAGSVDDFAGSTGHASPMGGATQVSVIVRGDQTALYLNNKPVAHRQDGDLDSPGGMYLAFWSDVEGNCEFDNVKFWDLQNVPDLP